MLSVEGQGGSFPKDLSKAVPDGAGVFGKVLDIQGNGLDVRHGGGALRGAALPPGAPGRPPAMAVSDKGAA